MYTLDLREEHHVAGVARVSIDSSNPASLGRSGIGDRNFYI
jgi:hypothetical protein